MTPVELVITPHAVERYVERIGGNEDEAVAILGGRVMRAAAQFGARTVRIPGGRVLLRFDQGRAIVLTVLNRSPTSIPNQLIPHALGGPPPSRDELPHLRKEPTHG